MTRVRKTFTKGQEALLEQLRKTLDQCLAAGIVFYGTAGNQLVALRKDCSDQIAEENKLMAYSMEGFGVSDTIEAARIAEMDTWAHECITDVGD